MILSCNSKYGVLDSHYYLYLYKKSGSAIVMLPWENYNILK